MQAEKQIIHKIHYKPPFKTQIPAGPHITPPLSLVTSKVADSLDINPYRKQAYFYLLDGLDMTCKDFYETSQNIEYEQEKRSVITKSLAIHKWSDVKAIDLRLSMINSGPDFEKLFQKSMKNIVQTLVSLERIDIKFAGNNREQVPRKCPEILSNALKQFSSLQNLGLTFYLDKDCSSPIKGYFYLIKQIPQIHHLQQFYIDIESYFYFSFQENSPSFSKATSEKQRNLSVNFNLGVILDKTFTRKYNMRLFTKHLGSYFRDLQEFSLMVNDMAQFDESEFRTIEKMLGRASASNTLRKLNLRIPETCINDENNFKLIMNLICKNTGLKQLSFTCQKYSNRSRFSYRSNSKVSEDDIIEIFTNICQKLPELESLYFELKGTYPITETGLQRITQEISQNLHQLKHLTLQLQYTPGLLETHRDQAIEIFEKNLPKLEEIQIRT